MEGLKITVRRLWSTSTPLSPKKFRKLSNARWISSFDGVVLAHVVELASSDGTAKILSGVVPYFGVRLDAKLLLFSPNKDMLLEGKVEKISQDTINIVVLGLCSVTITADEEFEFKTKNGVEICCSTCHRSHKVKAGNNDMLLGQEVHSVIGTVIEMWLSAYGKKRNR